MNATICTIVLDALEWTVDSSIWTQNLMSVGIINLCSAIVVYHLVSLYNNEESGFYLPILLAGEAVSKLLLQSRQVEFADCSFAQSLYQCLAWAQYFSWKGGIVWCCFPVYSYRSPTIKVLSGMISHCLEIAWNIGGNGLPNTCGVLWDGVCTALTIVPVPGTTNGISIGKVSSVLVAKNKQSGFDK